MVEISVRPSGINMMISASQHLQEQSIKSESASFPSESQSSTCVQPVCTGEVRLDPRRITAQNKSSPELPISFFLFSPFCSRLYSCALFPWLETGNDFFLPLRYLFTLIICRTALSTALMCTEMSYCPYGMVSFLMA